MQRLLYALIFLIAFSTTVYAQESPTTLDVEPTYVAMFKNGTGLVVVEGDVGQAGPHQITPLPQAMLGSLWLSWASGLNLSDITATYAENNVSVSAASVVDILRANIGRTVDLKTHDQTEWLRAEIVAMPDATPEVSPAIYPTPTPRGDLLVLRLQDGGTLAMAPGRVHSVRQPEGDLQDTLTRKTHQPTIRFTAANSRGQDRTVALTYMARGIAWSPSYVVEIDDEDEARLSAKAVVANDLIDLDQTPVELIAGYPNLQYADALSAMMLQPLDQILSQIRNTGGYRGNEPVIFSQRVMLDEMVVGAPPPTMPGTPVGGEATEDLYFYQLPAVTLKRGERGYFPLFAAPIPYTNLYTWDIPDFVDPYDQYQPQGIEQQEVVWHALKLTNTTDQPWTTAPAMTMKDGRVLGQSTLTFTPPQGTSQLRITQAVSIKAEQAELEVDRRREAIRFRNNAYDEVILEGTLSLTNYKTKAVTVEITKTVSGEVDGAEGNPQIVKLAQGMRRVNPRSRLTWTIAVPPTPDQAVKLTYRYRFYTR